MTSRKPFRPNWATHPGDHLKEWIEVSGQSQAAFARQCGLTTKLLSTIINRKAPVSALTALKLERSGHHTAQLWMNLQTNWDLHHARKRLRMKP